MVGIYKITNKLDGKVYIGQSNDIERRWYFYKNPPSNLNYNSLIISAILKYGVDNFSFEVVEECSVDELNERERFWISHFESFGKGYNLTTGGDHNVGSANPRALVTEEDVIFLRTLYASKVKETIPEIYQKYFADKCSQRAFEKIWRGETWAHIMPEVFTKENSRHYQTLKSRAGSKNGNAAFTDQEVMEIRRRFQEETIREIWEDYKDRVSFSALERMIIGTTYTYLPVYRKREKKWIIK